MKRTISMTILRNLLFISGFIRWMKSHSGWRRMRKAADRWCDSLGDLSLLSIAHSSTVLIRKSLLNPRCSKSGCTGVLVRVCMHARAMRQHKRGRVGWFGSKQERAGQGWEQERAGGEKR
jgi:hypothetical protein